MKRFIVKTLLFLLPLFILLILVEFGIRSIPNDYSYKNNWLEEHANEVKVLTFGSSHGYYGINPHAFSELTFNAAHVSQNLNYDKFIFSKFIDKADSLRCVVLPVSYFSLNGKVLIGGTEAWRNKKYMLYYECPYRRHSFMNWEIYNGKLLKNCKKVCKYALCDKNDVNVDSLGWCAMDEVEWLDDSQAAVKRHTASDIDYEKVRLSVERVRFIIEECRSRNINVVMVTLPAFETYREKLNERQLSIVVDSCNKLSLEYDNVAYLDLLADDRFERTDFFNSDHLCKTGATKVSVILQQAIDSLDRLGNRN